MFCGWFSKCSCTVNLIYDLMCGFVICWSWSVRRKCSGLLLSLQEQKNPNSKHPASPAVGGKPGHPHTFLVWLPLLYELEAIRLVPRASGSCPSCPVLGLTMSVRGCVCPSLMMCTLATHSLLPQYWAPSTSTTARRQCAAFCDAYHMI